MWFSKNFTCAKLFWIFYTRHIWPWSHPTSASSLTHHPSSFVNLKETGRNIMTIHLVIIRHVCLWHLFQLLTWGLFLGQRAGCVFSFFLAVVGIVPQWSIRCPRILLLSFRYKRLGEVFIQWVCQEEVVYFLCPESLLRNKWEISATAHKKLAVCCHWKL